jgi:hypothetical protein
VNLFILDPQNARIVVFDTSDGSAVPGPAAGPGELPRWFPFRILMGRWLFDYGKVSCA